ncbi:MAG TPA: hypothetical protein VGL93_17190 [Streptosporangiaceae bacterium]|jgi:hypothetical protein
MTPVAWLLVGGWLALLITMTRWPWLIAVGVLLAVRHRLDAGDLGGRNFEVAWYEAAQASGMPNWVARGLFSPRRSEHRGAGRHRHGH